MNARYNSEYYLRKVTVCAIYKFASKIVTGACGKWQTRNSRLTTPPANTLSVAGGRCHWVSGMQHHKKWEKVVD